MGFETSRSDPANGYNLDIECQQANHKRAIYECRKFVASSVIGVGIFGVFALAVLHAPQLQWFHDDSILAGSPVIENALDTRRLTNADTGDSAEIDCSKSLPLGSSGFKVSWELQGSNIKLTLTGSKQGVGWVGFGFAPQPDSMEGAEQIIAKISADSCEVGDYYSPQHMVQPSEDSPGNHISSECTISGSGAVMGVVVRPLTANGPNDISISTTKQNFIYAWSPRGFPNYHGSNRGGGEVSLETGTFASAEDNSKIRNVWAAHGVSMIFLFGVIMPGAVITVMFRASRGGFVIHKLLGQLGFGMLMYTLFTMRGVSKSNSTHGIVGTTIVLVSVGIALLGYTLDEVPTRVRRYFKYCHSGLGRSVLLGSPIAMWLGFRLYVPFESEVLRGTPTLWYSPMLVVIAAAIYERWSRGNKELVSYFEFEKMLKDGKNLIIIRNYIIDIDRWGHEHPGGTAVMEPYIGKDATSVFDGSISHTGKLGFAKKYRHSPLAERQLDHISTGKIEDFEGQLQQAQASLGRSRRGAAKDAEGDEEAGGKGGGLSDDVYNMKLAHVESLSTNHRLMIFETDSPLFPGHAVTFINPKTQVSREYSPIDVDITKGRLRYHFAIKIYPNGVMTQWLDNLEIGDIVLLRESACESLQSSLKHGCWHQMLMFAAGTGITPMLNLLSSHVTMAEQVKTDIVIVWWLPTLDDNFISYELLRVVSKALGSKFKLRICFTKCSQEEAKKCKLASLKNVEVVHGRQTEESLAWAKKVLSVKEDTKYARAFIAGTDAFCEDMLGRFRTRFPNLRNRLFLL